MNIKNNDYNLFTMQNSPEQFNLNGSTRGICRLFTTGRFLLLNTLVPK